MGINMLRNFYYIDAITIDNYLSSLEGSLYDAEEISEKSSNNRGINGDISLPLVKTTGGIKTQIETETSKKVIQTYAGKFQKIYSFLEQNNSVPFYDYMDENIWNEISRNQFVELDVNIRFSKIDNLISSIDKFFPFFGEIDPSILNDDSSKILYFTQLFKEINKLNGLPAELQLINGGNYKFVSYFKLDSFVTNMDSVPNETTILAKIQRKMRDSEKINLINLFPLVEKMAINREMRRSIKHIKTEIPEELTDNVKGPGAVIIPIAIYN